MMQLKTISVLTLLLMIYGGQSAYAGSQLPPWFTDPHLPGYHGFSVTASPQSVGGLDGQRRVAMMMARAELGRIKQVNVNSREQIRQSSSAEGSKVDMQSQVQVSSSQLLDLSKMEVREEWVDPATGELYLWILVPYRQP
jgi:hypothetical protein